MRKQRGVTTIGWIFLLVPVAVVLYAAIRVGPESFNYWKLTSAMAETAKKLEADESINQLSIQDALGKRFETGYIDEPKMQDIQISKTETGWEMTADYEKTVPLFGNLHLLMAFKNTETID